ncbi:MAG TPA: radical SAM protein [Thermoanaerobaculia bacterium]|nr:radical SAM protein [Thermoanaerobaculia bacterium]
MTALGWQHLDQSDKSNLLASMRTGAELPGPLHVEIHPADRCNIDCFFCSTATLRGTDEVPLRTWADFIHELKASGTRSVRLAGGGEPLFHRQIKEVLQVLNDERVPIENITTNGVLLTDKVVPLLLGSCDEITLSLNTSDPETYASMMQTPAKNFERVVKNAKNLIAARDAAKAKGPRLLVQFLVWKENFRSIPRMYDLAREMGADDIIFGGLAYLKPEQNMSPAETDEMMRLYSSVLRRDEYRRIRAVDTFEQDLRERVAAMNAELHQERARRSLFSRGIALLSSRERWRHFWAVRRTSAIERRIANLDIPCIIGWYSMVVRTSGEVGGCCILQGKRLGNVYQDSLEKVWHGEAYESFRQELRRIMLERDAWQVSPADKIVEPLCGGKTAHCPINFYYREDAAFVEALQHDLRALA